MRSRRLGPFASALVLSCLFAMVGLPDEAEAAGAGEFCLVSASCDGNLVCAFPQQECRHAPPILGEPCSAVVPCASGFDCPTLSLAFRCVHSPALEGERCDATAPCGPGLLCVGGRATGFCVAPRPKKTIGEGCAPVVNPCMDDLDCAPCLLEDCDAPFQCFPQGNNAAFSTEQCLSFYDSAFHDSVVSLGVARTIGGGTAASAGISGSDEVGVVYGPDGRYGCYLTLCIGGETNVAIENFVSLGFYNDYTVVRGDSIASIEEAGEIINFSTAQIFSSSDGFIGTSSCVSLGVSLFPISAGLYGCNTVVDTVVGDEPPQAVCADQTVCADELACTASADVDGGSFDPDGDPITLEQSPESPYPIGSHTVTLAATDSGGNSDSCIAAVMVDDCTPPSIACPAPTIAECESAEQALVDPGDASVTDCSSFTVTDPGPASYPVGTTDVEYVAEDIAGNSASCTTQVTVVDTTAPTITAVTATPSALSPPNHELRTVQIEIEASDLCDPTLTCEVVEVASNEPEGRKTPDSVILGPQTVSLRAEREGEGSGRVYTITVECRGDTGGNATQAITTVTVPHDQRSTER